MRVRRFVVGWTGLLFAGWLFLGVIPATKERECDVSRDWICFDPWAIALVVGAYVAGLWLFGIFVIGVVAGLIRWHRKLTAPAQEP